ncbi:hypothetical protein Q2K21_27650 [Streptomyces sp. CGMCC 4.7035]|nr:hypothetical protein [Streptomyces sp. CGMCC 4.7035]WNC01534.1 hypothetical protein Q2K21_27650 [Streptomyces sp. CGMCC 4.7035]
MTGGYQGRRGVTEDRQQYLGQRTRVAAGQMRDREDRDAGQAEAEPGHPPDAQPFRVAEEAGQDHPDDRYARDQQARRGAGQMPFGVGEREPGAHDLDAREGQQGPPVVPHGPGQAPLP